MRGPSLYLTATVSLIAHLGFLSLAGIATRQMHFDVPAHYVVTLVSPPEVEISGGQTPMAKEAAGVSAPRTQGLSAPISQGPVALANKPVAVKQPPSQTIPEDGQYTADKIARLRAVKDIKRRRTIDIGKQSRPPSGNPSNDIPDKYHLEVEAAIRLQWVYPGAGGKDIETVVFATIMKNGTIKIDAVRPSGNPAYDESVMRALKKAIPLPPPPYEREVELRFRP